MSPLPRSRASEWRRTETCPCSPAAWRVAAPDRPDRRLALFHRGVPADFWPDTWKRWRDLLGEEAWPVFAPSAPSAEALTRTFGEEFDPVVRWVGAYLDDRLEKLLEQRGARTVKTNGEDLRHAVEMVQVAGLPVGGHRNFSLKEQSLAHLFRERTLLSDLPRPARLLVVDDYQRFPFIQTGPEGRPRDYA